MCATPTEECVKACDLLGKAKCDGAPQQSESGYGKHSPAAKRKLVQEPYGIGGECGDEQNGHNAESVVYQPIGDEGSGQTEGVADAETHGAAVGGLLDDGEIIGTCEEETDVGNQQQQSDKQQHDACNEAETAAA